MVSIGTVDSGRVSRQIICNTSWYGRTTISTSLIETHSWRPLGSLKGMSTGFCSLTYWLDTPTLSTLSPLCHPPLSPGIMHFLFIVRLVIRLAVVQLHVAANIYNFFCRLETPGCLHDKPALSPLALLHPPSLSFTSLAHWAVCESAAFNQIPGEIENSLFCCDRVCVCVCVCVYTVIVCVCALLGLSALPYGSLVILRGAKRANGTLGWQNTHRVIHLVIDQKPGKHFPERVIHVSAHTCE